MTYPKEYDTAVGITELLSALGAGKVTLVDYNEIVKSAGGAGAGEAAIKDSLRRFLQDHNVDRILIPGNYYNLVSQPLSPVPNRQLVTDAVVSLMSEGADFALLGICGGLQGVLHSQHVKLNTVESILRSSKMAESHVMADPNPRLPGIPLTRVSALPQTKLASIVKRAGAADDLVFYMPDAHREAADNTEENMARLKALGYKVAAVSDDGIIEALEDSRGNILIQMHPEYLLMNADKKAGKHHAVDLSIRVALAIIEDFLGRNPAAGP
ncbi:gamma-glutamyl-gamma-aminobutyrate hydrolase family protein [Anaplasma capra]|uniref:gamma-glutamyl-gamma-aminobutyrate hydrolase family protein n=1 Tax=Anaplasma capra TaxID=1562740 RepID=UPI0021D5E858|nr:gamma-glutamyl-gamma-aminobutyrate hydrolase family protein [Anaplasma capra]MCU7611531.1 gamma-glutamyl-gamma-aminobutyrate hydrolase family protein [Anaplasma capra]MCU7612030.1 gamma-glutamyl-gamma-aminobutyrate hydrolase family protein [Anaplasma capra]